MVQLDYVVGSRCEYRAGLNFCSKRRKWLLINELGFSIPQFFYTRYIHDNGVSRWSDNQFTTGKKTRQVKNPLDARIAFCDSRADRITSLARSCLFISRHLLRPRALVHLDISPRRLPAELGTDVRALGAGSGNKISKSRVY